MERHRKNAKLDDEMKISPKNNAHKRTEPNIATACRSGNWATSEHTCETCDTRGKEREGEATHIMLVSGGISGTLSSCCLTHRTVRCWQEHFCGHPSPSASPATRATIVAISNSLPLLPLISRTRSRSTWPCPIAYGWCTSSRLFRSPFARLQAAGWRLTAPGFFVHSLTLAFLF